MRFRPLAIVVACLALGPCSLALGAKAGPLEAAPPKAYTQESESFNEGNVRNQLLFGFVKTHGIATRVEFQFGRTTAYGRYAYMDEHPYGFNNGYGAEAEGEADRLRPDTTYHYRLVAWNERGRSFGQDRTFHTAPLRPMH